MSKNVLSVVQEVMSQIIADIAENSTTKHSSRRTPIIKEDSMRQLPERHRKNYEESWRHDKSISVHGQVVVDTVQQEVCCKSYAVVWQVPVQMEEATVQTVLDQRPDA